VSRAVHVAALALALGAGCATTHWADEPGRSVPLSLAANEEMGDQFLNALTAARSANGLPAPVITPRYQSEIRNFAEDLQSGKTSAAGAQRAITAWGRNAFQSRVVAWALDCGGPKPEIPDALATTPSAVVSYAAAYFRPQSSPADQCAVLVISVQAH
jgi:hypothetical protein